MHKKGKLSTFKLIKCGNVIEVFEYEKPFIYSRDPYPYKEGEKQEGRRRDHIVRAQSSIRRLVNSNANAFGCMPIFITYTFKENITDLDVANSFYTAHIRSLKLMLDRHLRYVCVPEYQEKRAEMDGLGAWHFHTIFFDMPYIEGLKKILSITWPHGFFKVKAIKHVRNVGAYVSKYFSKQWAKRRPLHRKSYFSSSGLFLPEISYQQSDFDELCQYNRIISEMSRSYDTEKYGKIIYKQYRIIK